MIFFDQHSHTTFSPDAQMSIEGAVSRILNDKLNIKGIAFTDHLDLDPPVLPEKFRFDIKEQQEQIEKFAKAYIDSGLQLFKGIEVGLQLNANERSKEYISSHKFDIIIASLHFIDGTDPYKGTYYIGKDYRRAFSHALQVMYENITNFNDFDVLGHKCIRTLISY